MADTDSALRKKIQAVQRNENFTPQQKAQAMQALMSSKWNANNHTNKGEPIAPLSPHATCIGW
jgi:hypothetical protein